MKRIVVKVGSRVLANEDGGLDGERLAGLGSALTRALADGVEVVIVSSGAITCGWPRLGLAARPRSLPELQASAAAGQSLLMRAWEEVFTPHEIACAQVLLTHEDVADRQRFLNARETLLTLLRHGVIPIVNENDTISIDEIRFGDNDNLSADVTVLTDADHLLILTEVDGLMTADPRLDDSATLVTEVRDIDAEAIPIAGPGSGEHGTGGMITKVEAARKAVSSGATVIIASGIDPTALPRLLAGEAVGTRFVASEDQLRARKHWIAYTLKPSGTVVIDAGARTAVEKGGKSLLPSGVKRVEGMFDRGASVSLADEAGAEFARGLTTYSANELRQIAGLKSGEIERTLGYTFGDEVVHRDDLALL